MITTGSCSCCIVFFSSSCDISLNPKPYAVIPSGLLAFRLGQVCVFPRMVSARLPDVGSSVLNSRYSCGIGVIIFTPQSEAVDHFKEKSISKLSIATHQTQPKP